MPLSTLFFPIWFLIKHTSLHLFQGCSKLKPCQLLGPWIINYQLLINLLLKLFSFHPNGLNIVVITPYLILSIHLEGTHKLKKNVQSLINPFLLNVIVLPSRHNHYSIYLYKITFLYFVFQEIYLHSRFYPILFI